jgi:hypothetical protein
MRPMAHTTPTANSKPVKPKTQHATRTSSPPASAAPPCRGVAGCAVGAFCCVSPNGVARACARPCDPGDRNLHQRRCPNHSSRFPNRAGIYQADGPLPVLPAPSRPCRSSALARCLPLLGSERTAGGPGLAGFFLRSPSLFSGRAARPPVEIAVCFAPMGTSFDSIFWEKFHATYDATRRAQANAHALRHT